MRFHRLFFAAVVGLGGAALLIVGLWAGYAALGIRDSQLGILAAALGLSGVVACLIGYRLLQRELAKDRPEANLPN